MKVVCDRSALLDAINAVAGAVPARTPRVALTCIKLAATRTGPAGALTLSATDAELAIKVTLAQVDVASPGEALVPADKLRQIVSAEESEPTLTLDVQQDICHIRGVDAHFKVFCQPVADFPPIPDFASVVSGSGGVHTRAQFTQSAGALNDLVAKTLFAAARENSRYAINGVLIRREGKRIEFVATDGRRLALCRATVPGPADRDAKPVTCIVPAKALNTLARLSKDPEEAVHVAITDAQVFFAFVSPGEKDASRPRAVLASTLVEGAFPPYEDVIPKDQDKKITFDRDTLNYAVRRAAILTNEESRGVKLAFKGAAKRLEISSRAQETGEANITADLAAYEGADIEIGFNPHFLTDALKVLAETEVIMELKAPSAPALIKTGPKSAGSDFVYVVMPVTLQ
ncbi:MAG: DNA polymerase III subunit beta [Phycisphaerae bacterium]|nr:DNA polymerase III subunit beta [Phycisphaerae bacterium]